MEFRSFSRNGQLRPLAEAVVPLSNIEYQYGFGVYETIRVARAEARFLDEYIDRLLASARIIALAHSFDAATLDASVRALIGEIGEGTYNLKVILIGGEQPQLYILPLNPHFPDRKLYRDGAHAILYEYERAYPQAKSLNMFGSYLAYAKAKEAGAYDALLVNKNGCITEGTRTNFFCLKGKTIVSPPEDEILLGVTRKHVLEIAARLGLKAEPRDIPYRDISRYDAAFLTSTSSRIMPLRSIDSFTFGPRPLALDALMDAFDKFLDSAH